MTISQNISCALLAMLAGVASVSTALGYTIEPQQSGNVTYITGGIGDEEREAVKSVKNDYNLSIISASKDGAYVGNTHVVIADRNGESLVDTNADPLFYAQLPPGKYIVKGESRGQTRTQNVTIAENKPAHVHFSWE